MGIDIQMGYYGLFQEHSATSGSAKIRNTLELVTVTRQSDESRPDFGGRQRSRESEIFVGAAGLYARQRQLAVIILDMLIYKCCNVCCEDLQSIFVMCAEDLSCFWR